MSNGHTVRPGLDGRIEGGRFAPGNAIGRGNPHAKRMHEFRKALLDSAQPDDIQRVARRLVEAAEAGDVQAAKLWLEYVIGKPPQAIELSGTDGEPLLNADRLTSLVLSALGGYPEARIRVAVALRKALSDDARGDEPTGDDPGPVAHHGGPRPDAGPVAAGRLEVDDGPDALTL